MCPRANGQQGFIPATNRYYLFHGRPALTGTDVRLAVVEFDPKDRPVVVIKFTKRGTVAFKHLTLITADLGFAEDSAAHVAIVVGGRLWSWPSVDFRRYPNGFSDGTVAITGVSVGEATRLVSALTAGLDHPG